MIEEPKTALTPLNPTGNEISTKRVKAEDALWRWNVAMALLHGVQGAAALAAAQFGNANKFKMTMVTSRPDWSRNIPTVALQKVGELPFASLTSGFAFMSCAAHAIVLCDFARYKANLREGINVHRWYEYSVSSSLMIVLIAMLFGDTDAMSLALMAGCNASMCLFGLLHERMNARVEPAKVNWEPFWFGCFAGGVPWAVIFAYILSSPNIARVPGFVWGVLAAYIFFFNTFPINM